LVVGGVMCLHLGLWRVLQADRPRQERAAVLVPLAQVRPLEGRPPDRRTTMPMLPVPRTLRPAAPTIAPPALPIDLPPLAAPQNTLALPAPPASSPTRTALPPLDLSLPKGATRSDPGVRQRALDDPRANTPQTTLEARIGAAIGSVGTLRVEDLGGGRRRVYQGTRCLEVHDTRIATIDPFNQSVLPSPKQARRCD
jgi:hypothetical protein